MGNCTDRYFQMLEAEKEKNKPKIKNEYPKFANKKLIFLALIVYLLILGILIYGNIKYRHR
jgi:hypothetical protein